ncbi:MAG: hypothetical protein AB7O48_12385 [Cyclobacteriaceae bacterium]
MGLVSQSKTQLEERKQYMAGGHKGGSICKKDKVKETSSAGVTVYKKLK